MPGLLAIVGATATGKTALANELAKRLDGEIINADSRQVYRGMDIGTAKPSPAEQAAARHWLIDVIAPRDPYTLADFLDGANAAIADISARGKLPILCGGTGQYVWALLEGWRVPRVPPNQALRNELEATVTREGVATIARQLIEMDPAAAKEVDLQNPRRVIRAIEVLRATGRTMGEWRRREAPSFAATMVGLSIERAALYQRIDARVDRMLEAGLVEEVRTLIADGNDCGLPSMSGIGYRQICEHLVGECTLDQAITRIKTATHRLARMQHTWFRADDARIGWLDALAPDLVEQATIVATATSSR
jgi:tRNA dimethylallyltransferase